MNKELFDSMNKQMTPSPEVRAALSEKLARPAKKRPVPWKKYAAVAACAVLVIGAFSVYNLYQDYEKWGITVRNFQRDPIELTMHSYVTVEGLTGYVTENAAANDTGTGGTEVNTGDPPADIETVMREGTGQEEALNAYQKLMGHFALGYPNWYGGAYIDDDNNLMVLLVSDKDPGDKSLELKVLDWTGSDKVVFGSAKYSLRYLRTLQDKVCNAMMELGLFSSCGTYESENRLHLSLTSVTDEALALLARLDPDDDAIYVQVGQRASTDSASTEDPAVHHVVPGGVTVPDDEDLIAEEPYYDGARYDVLPEELPEQKQPAFVETGSLPEENTSAFTPAYDPDIGFIYPKE